MENYRCIEISKNLINNESLIGKGEYGSVYYLNENECIKIWKNKKSDSFIEKINSFIDFDVDCATFPHNLVVIDGIVRGYTMDYVSGINISDYESMDFSFFILSYNNLIKKIRSEVTKLGIHIEDIKLDNIMHDIKTNAFRCIDTDFWWFHRPARLMRPVPLEHINFVQFESILERNVFFPMSFNIDEKTDFVDYFESLKTSIETKKCVKIKTIGDFNKYRS